MTPAPITLPDHTRGDTWVGIPTVGPIGVSGEFDEYLTPLGTTAISAKLHFIPVNGTTPVFRCETGGGGDAPILIVTAAPFWEFSVPPVSPTLFTLPVGNYIGMLQVTDSDGVKSTFHRYVLPIPFDNTL